MLSQLCLWAWAACSEPFRHLLQNVHPHGHHTCADHVDLFRGFEAEIDDSAFSEWSPVSDADDYLSVVGGVGDTHARSKWQCAVGRREGLVAEGLAARCSGSVGSGRIPGSLSLQRFDYHLPLVA